MANLTTQNLAIAKLYTALFNRAPDAGGFAFWVQALENGASLDVIAQSMLSAPEALAIYPAAHTSAQFVTAYYTSVFGRAPDAGGLTFWSAALDAQGGAGNAAGRAALIMQISTLVSTPLTSKPEGMSDAAYNQTVADRARFINKTEFGVYFASELKSNDLTLAKSTLALVTDSANSLVAATNLSKGIVDQAPGPAPIVVPSITAADTPATIAAKFAAYTGTAGTVDATGLSAVQLREVSLASAKIMNAGLTGTMSLTSDLIQNELATLLGNMVSQTATVNVDATGMTPQQLSAIGIAASVVTVITNLTQLPLGDNAMSAIVVNGLLLRAADASVVATGANFVVVGVLANHIAKIVDNGITGTLAMTNALSAEQITALLGAKTAEAADVQVNASGMTTAQLVAVGLGSAKVDSLSNLPALVLGDAAMSDAATAGLLSKASGASVVITGATETEIGSVVTNIANIADNGITGTLTLTNAQTAAQLTALLGAKTGDATATVSVDASTMDLARLQAVAAGMGKVDSLSNLPQLVLSDLTAGETDALLSKVTSSSTTVVATSASNAELVSLATYIDKITAGGISGTLGLSSSLTAAQLTALLGTKTGDATATVSVDASTMDLPRLQSVAAGIAKVDSLTNLPQLVLGALTDAETDALLGKVTASGAVTVSATSASTAELVSLVTYGDKIAANGVTGDLSLSAALTDVQLTALLGAKTADAANVQVNAAGMNTTRLVTLNGNLGKVDGITGMSLTFSDAAMTNAVATSLLAKATAGSTTAIVTGAGADVVSTLITSNDRLVDSGITGDLTVTNALSAPQITTLLGTKTHVDANVQVNAASMDTSKLSAVAGGIAKADQIVSLTMEMGNFTNDANEALLSKASGAAVTAYGTVSSTSVSSLMNHLSNMSSLSGAWTMSAAQLGSKAALLDSKLGSAELKVAGDTSNDTINLAALTKAAALHVNGGAGADRIVFSGTLYNDQKVYINSRADTHADPQTTDTGIGNFDSISGVNNNTYVRFSTAADVFGSGITLSLGSIAVTSTASIGSAATIADVLAAANTLSPVASTSGGGGAKIYLVKVTGGSNDLAGNTFAILNDENPEITIADTIIVIGGTTIPNSMFEAGALLI